jgi:hypothetical protein
VKGLRVDTVRMAENLRAAVAGDQPPPAGIDELIDRALAAHISPAVEPGGFTTARPAGPAPRPAGERPPEADVRASRRDVIS